MTEPRTDRDWRQPALDREAGALVRPYAYTQGRTAPSRKLDLLSLLESTGRVPLSAVDTEAAEVLGLCREKISVAEVSAHLKIPAMVARILACDLLAVGAVTVSAPVYYAAPPPGEQWEPPPKELLQALLDGLQRRL